MGNGHENLAQRKRDAWEGQIRLYVGHSGADPDAATSACETEEHGMVISAADVVVLYREP